MCAYVCGGCVCVCVFEACVNAINSAHFKSISPSWGHIFEISTLMGVIPPTMHVQRFRLVERNLS